MPHRDPAELPPSGPIGEVERVPKTSRRTPRLIAGLVVLASLGLFGGLAWYAFIERRGLLREAPPLIAAPKEPYRVPPEERGGLPLVAEPVPEREESGDEEVVLLEEPKARSLEELLPTPGGPETQTPPAAAAGPAGVAEAPPAPPVAPSPPLAEEAPEVAPAPAGGPEIATENPLPDAPLERLAVEPAAGEDVGEEVPAAKPRAAAPERPQEQVARAAAPAVTAEPPPRGPVFRVQLAAVSSEARAREAWRRLQRRFPSILRDEDPVIRPLRRGERVLYRVQFGAFASRAEARKACDAIRAAGGDCFVISAGS